MLVGIITTAFFIALLWAIIRIVEDNVEHDVIMVPTHMTVSEMEACTAQEVYDWVVYVTKLTGRSYLEQLAFDNNHRHADLLSDMQRAIYFQTHELIMSHLHEVGHTENLNTKIIDAPY